MTCAGMSAGLTLKLSPLLDWIGALRPRFLRTAGDHAPRIVHHADVITLKGSSYRLKDTGIDTLPSARAENAAP